ncbi:MAG: dihydroorotate dehydrogenase-like protein [Desulfopila sp.]
MEKQNLATTYLGLKLKNPLLVGSCELTGSVKGIRELAAGGAAGVVLKSLFEEQIEIELAGHLAGYQSDYPGACEYMRNFTRNTAVDDYLTLIAGAKSAVDIPIIASINCVSASEWIAFADSVEKAGADALELNLSLLPSHRTRTGAEVEQIYFDIVKKVSDRVSLPIAVKMSSSSAGLASLIDRLARSGDCRVSGFVLFNRHYRPDINIDTMEMTMAEPFSTPAEITEPLRWIGLLSGSVEADFASSTGVHDRDGMIKLLLAGAAAVQVVSTVYQHGPGRIAEILSGVREWMAEKSFGTIADFQGRLRSTALADPAVYERIQFIRQFAGGR